MSAAPPLHEPGAEPRDVIVAMHPGFCHRGRHPFGRGWSIVKEGPDYSCADCVENDIEPPQPVDPEALVEHARTTLRTIARLSGPTADEGALAEIHQLAVQENAVLAQQRRAA